MLLTQAVPLRIMCMLQLHTTDTTLPSIPWDVEAGPQPANIVLYAGSFAGRTGPVVTQSPMLIFTIAVPKVGAGTM